MAFGVSGAEGRPAMLGADVVVAYWDSRYIAKKLLRASIEKINVRDIIIFTISNSTIFMRYIYSQL